MTKYVYSNSEVADSALKPSTVSPQIVSKGEKPTRTLIVDESQVVRFFPDYRHRGRTVNGEYPNDKPIWAIQMLILEEGGTWKEMWAGGSFAKKFALQDWETLTYIEMTLDM
jgi:hypothetical protein